MARLYWQGVRPDWQEMSDGTKVSSGGVADGFFVEADTPEEMHELVSEEMERRGIENVRCVGLQNNRKDFTEIFGEVDDDCKFKEDLH